MWARDGQTALPTAPAPPSKRLRRAVRALCSIVVLVVCIKTFFFLEFDLFRDGDHSLSCPPASCLTHHRFHFTQVHILKVYAGNYIITCTVTKGDRFNFDERKACRPNHFAGDKNLYLACWCPS